MPSYSLTHLDQLEAESIAIFREVVACFKKPVLMYSIGKDSSVLIHLARKAFYPGKIPFPILHIDTTFKFKEMITFRDRFIRGELDLNLIVYTNQDGVKKGVTPFTHGSSTYTDIMKTEALKQALKEHQFDCAIGGARRDEERSRAKERIFSFRNQHHQWDPKGQRPELWRLWNTRIRQNESMRAFPISNWTELDVWHYIKRESISVVPLYFAAKRPVVHRGDTMIMVDDDRLPLEDGEIPELHMVRFRTLGCYPLTGAVDSTASNVTDVLGELLRAETSERRDRLIDGDQVASMEKKKKEGYF